MKTSKQLLICLLISLFTITACDNLSRFSYENYECKPSRTSLYEIRVSQLKKGSMANISFATDQTLAKITSLSKREIVIESEKLHLIVNRQTGITQVFKNNVYETIPCIIDKFKM